ncbi:MAG: hypothetical protein AB7T32_06530, partial [Dehalococcoidia bacterium]
LPLTAAARVAVDFMIENRRLPIISVDDDRKSTYQDADLLAGSGDEEAEARPPSTAQQEQEDQVLAPDGPVGGEEPDQPSNGASKGNEPEKTS